MPPEDRVLVIIGDQIVTSQRLQRYGFLLSKRFKNELAGMDFYSDWIRKRSAPYSKSLKADLKECMYRGLVECCSDNTSDTQYYLSQTGLARWDGLVLPEIPKYLESLRESPSE